MYWAKDLGGGVSRVTNVPRNKRLWSRYAGVSWVGVSRVWLEFRACGLAQKNENSLKNVGFKAYRGLGLKVTGFLSKIVGFCTVAIGL